MAAKQTCPVRIQWDAERSPRLGRLEYRTIQIGLARDAVVQYAEAWIQRIIDLTDYATAMRERVNRKCPAHYEGATPCQASVHPQSSTWFLLPKAHCRTLASRETSVCDAKEVCARQER